LSRQKQPVMLPYKKIVVSASLALFMIAGIAATNRVSDDKPPKRNLKILPKDISGEDLDKIMDQFKEALGVRCNFCHAASKDSASRRLDFASDEKPEKGIARHMMRMTGKIDKKYFHYDKDDKGAAMPPVTCMTCHRGKPHPEAK
jgi:hypothetical protein